MLNTYRKIFLIVSSVLLFLVMATGFAFGDMITIDAIADAGQYPGQSAYIEFQLNGVNVAGVTTSDVPTQWTSSAEVSAYALANGISWNSIVSAGNIWSSNTVGVSLTEPPGTYIITPISGAFEYDSFGWSNEPGWWWLLDVTVNGNPPILLGGPPNDTPDGGYGSSGAALSSVLSESLPITLPEGGTLTFWIQDNPTIDNRGSLTFDVEQIPEPATILLLCLGLIGIPGIRRFIK
ncbi:MAG: PEP-CTERM sorting domain-containing protein [Smithella sp.]